MFWPQVACLHPVLTEEEKQALTERTVKMFMNTYTRGYIRSNHSHWLQLIAYLSSRTTFS